VKTLSPGYPAPEHLDVFRDGVWTWAFFVFCRYGPRLVGALGKHRRRLNQVGDVLEDQAIPLRAILTLRSFAPGGVDKVGRERCWLLNPAIHGPGSNLSLNLIATDTNYSVRLSPRVSRIRGWKIWFQRRDPPYVPPHLGPEQNRVEDPPGR
jgi:hypothetical protein